MTADRRSTWDPCPEGELGRMVEGLRQRRSLRVVGRTSIAAALVLVVATGVGVAVSLYSPRLTCGEVVRLLPEYDQGVLSTRLARRVEEHLDHCPGCRKHHEELHGGGEPPDGSRPDRFGPGESRPAGDAPSSSGSGDAASTS